MAMIEKQNVVLRVPEDQLADYLRSGFKKIEEAAEQAAPEPKPVKK